MIDGAAAAAFLAAFAALFLWALVATRREQRDAELDTYRECVDRPHGGGW